MSDVMRRNARGFTLLEVMIAMVIVAILAAVAYPSYIRHVQDARRNEAKTALLDTANQLERCFTEHYSYQADGCPSGSTSAGDYYTLTIITPSASKYRLEASPKAGSAQAGDRCGTLTLNQTGQRDLENTSDMADGASCDWQ
ncbi:type IV pilin protein [Modicisalibacter tunisiensis]|nr:type IV pilin protein [Modicisalibacter tunisiensis]